MDNKPDRLIELLNTIFPDGGVTSQGIERYLKSMAEKTAGQAARPAAATVTARAKKTAKAPAKKARGSSSDPYPVFKRMRQIGGNEWLHFNFYSNYDSEKFVRQARFMEDFTDSCGRSARYESRYPTYSRMDDAQLRTYFTWRTDLRRGESRGTDFSYVLCYIFELLNDVGAKSAQDAMEKMIGVWKASREHAERLDELMRTWLRDYYATHASLLPEKFTFYASSFPVPYHEIDEKIMNLAADCSWDSLEAIEASSSHRITTGVFYRTSNRQAIEKCVCLVLGQLSTVFSEARADMGRLFTERRRETIALFKGAVHPEPSCAPAIINVDDFETLTFNGGEWTVEYLTVTPYKTAVGFLLKMIEAKMRQRFGFSRKFADPDPKVLRKAMQLDTDDGYSWEGPRSRDPLLNWKLKVLSLLSNPSLALMITRWVDSFASMSSPRALLENTGAPPAQIEFDMSRLEAIEREYAETSMTLLPPDGDSEPYDACGERACSVAVATGAPVCEAEAGLSGLEGLVASLTGPERALVGILVSGTALRAADEILIESVNAKAQETIGDNLISSGEDGGRVYGEYAGELAAILETSL